MSKKIIKDKITKNIQSNKPKVALITGSSGFVGKHLSTYLQSQNLKVYGIERNFPFGGFDAFECDILDVSRLKEVLKEIKPDYIFHLAAQSSVESSWKDPVGTFRINVEGTDNLINCVEELKLNSIILIASSGEVYGTAKSYPFTEQTIPEPNSPYSKSKLAQEEIALEHFKKNGTKIIISRSFPHNGPNQSENFACSSFAKQIVQIEKGEMDNIIVGNLDASRDYTDVRDIVKAYYLAVQKCKSGEIYNICSGKAYTIKEILDNLINLSTKKIITKSDKKKLRPSDIPLLLGDNKKFCTITNWKPYFTLNQTLKDTLDFWRNNLIK